MKEMPVAFKSGSQQVIGMLHLSNFKNKPLIIICHGFTASKEGPYYIFVQTSRKFCENGYNVLRFDFRGSADSEGRLENQNFSSLLKDLRAATNFLSKFKEIDLTRIGLIGHSKGGSAAILFARNNPNVKCIALWSTVADYNLFRKGHEKEFRAMLQRGYEYYYGFKIPIKIFLDNLKQNLLKAIKNIKSPILFVHGNKDRDVPLIHSKLLLKASNPPKKLIKIKNADHIFTKPEDREAVIKETVKWFKRYL